MTMNYKPSILQWNLNGFRAQYEYLQLLMLVHNPAVISLQESNFSEEYMAPSKIIQVTIKTARMHIVLVAVVLRILKTPSHIK